MTIGIKPDIVVIVSRDSGFLAAVPGLKLNGKRINMPGSGTSGDLFRAAGKNSKEHKAQAGTDLQL